MTMRVTMPSLGMTMEEGRVVHWRVKEGEAIARGQVLVDIESEKTAYEVESPTDGIVEKILVASDAVVPVGTALCSLVAHGAPVADGKRQEESGTETASAQSSLSSAARRRMSPRARRLAEELGVDVAHIAARNPDGVIQEEDILAAQKTASAQKAAPSPAPAGSFDVESRFELRPLTAMRRVTAERMVESARNAPHFYLAVEMDGSALLNYQREHGARLATETETKLTITDLLVAVTARTLMQHRALNASYTPEGIREWNSVDLGLAVAVDGGLIVPVIRGAEGRSLAEVMLCRADLVARARNGKLAHADVELGTFTLSNLGALGVDFFTSILNPPQAAILSIGTLIERPCAVGGAVVVRPTMLVGLTIDHRVADGAAGARFLADLRRRIEAGAIDDN